jgi:hypothetical protein
VISTSPFSNDCAGTNANDSGYPASLYICVTDSAACSSSATVISRLASGENFAAICSNGSVFAPSILKCFGVSREASRFCMAESGRSTCTVTLLCAGLLGAMAGRVWVGSPWTGLRSA